MSYTAKFSSLWSKCTEIEGVAKFGFWDPDKIVRWCALIEVENECSAPHIILDRLPTLRQKLSELMKIPRIYGKNNLLGFWDTVYVSYFDCHWEPSCPPFLHRRDNNGTSQRQQHNE